jgi:hypothetical protein
VPAPGDRVPVDDRANDLHPRYTGHVRNDVVQLQVHEGQRLLHVLDMRRCVVEVAFAQPQVDSQRSNVAAGMETGAQQSTGVQPLQPLCIVDIGLAARNRSRLSGVGQDHLDPAAFQHFVHRHPIHAGGFHGDVLMPIATSQSAMR